MSLEEGSAAERLASLVGAPGSRWLLIVGGRLSASSGVPLPFERTRWAPSVNDMVHHHLFKTQSRELFRRVEGVVREPRPPLGLIADSLDEQEAWLLAQLEDLKPSPSLLRVADLARAGTFDAIVTSAADKLLMQALDRVGVSWREVTAESASGGGAGELPVLREWDDRLYADTEDRRARESAFIRSRLEALLPTVDGVLVLGHTAEVTDLTEALTKGLQKAPGVPVVWVEETLGDDPQPSDTVDWLAAHHGRFEHLVCEDLTGALGALADARGAELSPLSDEPPPAPPLWSRALNRSFDVRPVLVYVPGVNLFGGLLDRLPRFNLKMVFSLLLAVFLFVGWVNWSIWREYASQIEPAEELVAKAKTLLAEDPSEAGAIRAENELARAQGVVERVTIPKKSIFSFDELHDQIDFDYAGVAFSVEEARDFGVTPQLFMNRFKDEVAGDPALASLGAHPPIRVHEEPRAVPGGLDPANPRDLIFEGRPLESWRQPRPLSDYMVPGAAPKRLALHSESAPLLRVTMQKQLLADLDAGRMAFEVDLSRQLGAPLDAQILAEAGRIAGYVGERKKLYSPDGIIERLSEGDEGCAFYFMHIDAGGVPRAMGRIDNLLARFPRCDAIIATYSERARRQLAALAPGYERVRIAEYPWAEALAWLREHTAPEFVRAVIENGYLRRGITNPLVLSLLVDYHRFVGQAPSSLARVYDRLLTNMLAKDGEPFAPRAKSLSALAWETLGAKGMLTTERAVQVIADTLSKGLKLDQATAQLEALVAAGVMRYRTETHVELQSEALMHVAAAKYLQRMPVEARAEALRGIHRDITAFHAGLVVADGEIDGLVAALLRPFRAVQAELRAKKAERTHFNPFAPDLVKAALAVANGPASEETTALLVETLIEQMSHAAPQARDQAMEALSELSTPGIRRWVLTGIENDLPHDHQLLQYAARAPQDIYVGAVERWLRRVGTPLDHRQSERFFEAQAGRSDNEMRVTTPNYETAMAIGNALSVLVQVGTQDSLRLVEEVAARRADPRFHEDAWLRVRARAMRVLISNGYVERVEPFVDEVAAAPDEWSMWLFHRMYRMNNAAAAKALGRILSAEGDWKDRKLRERKRVVAWALASMDRAVARPVLVGLLEAPAPEGEAFDWKPYAALALGIGGHPEDLGVVRAFVERAHKDARLAELKHHSVAEQYRDVVNRAIATFATDEALALYRELWALEGWNSEDEMVHWLSRFKSEGALALAMEQLLCVDREARDTWDFIRAMGRMGTPAARERIGELLQITGGRSAEGSLRELCREAEVAGALERVAGWDREDLTARLVGALASRPAESDIPRFAGWAMHPSARVRRAALEALSLFGDPEAARALQASATRYPESRRDALKAMARQGSAANEAYLLGLVDDPELSTLAFYIFDALRTSGGLATLTRLYPMQADKQRGKAVTTAIARASARGGLPLEQVLAAVRQVPAPAEQPEADDRIE